MPSNKSKQLPKRLAIIHLNVTRCTASQIAIHKKHEMFLQKLDQEFRAKKLCVGISYDYSKSASLLHTPKTSTHATVCLTFITLWIAEQYPAVTPTKYDPFCMNILNSMCI